MLVSDGTAAVIRDDLGPAQTIRSGFADERFRRSLAAQRAPGRRASTSSPEFDVASDADVAAPVDRATPSVQIDAEGKRRHQLGEPNLVGVLIHLVTISASQVATTGTAVTLHPAAAWIRVIHEGARLFALRQRRYLCRWRVTPVATSSSFASQVCHRRFPDGV